MAKLGASAANSGKPLIVWLAAENYENNGFLNVVVQTWLSLPQDQFFATFQYPFVQGLLSFFHQSNHFEFEGLDIFHRFFKHFEHPQDRAYIWGRLLREYIQKCIDAKLIRVGMPTSNGAYTQADFDLKNNGPLSERMCMFVAGAMGANLMINDMDREKIRLYKDECFKWQITFGRKNGKSFFQAQANELDCELYAANGGIQYRLREFKELIICEMLYAEWKLADPVPQLNTQVEAALMAGDSVKVVALLSEIEDITNERAHHRSFFEMKKNEFNQKLTKQIRETWFNIKKELSASNAPATSSLQSLPGMQDNSPAPMPLPSSLMDLALPPKKEPKLEKAACSTSSAQLLFSEVQGAPAPALPTSLMDMALLPKKQAKEEKPKEEKQREEKEEETDEEMMLAQAISMSLGQ